MVLGRDMQTGRLDLVVPSLPWGCPVETDWGRRARRHRASVKSSQSARLQEPELEGWPRLISRPSTVSSEGS